MSRRPSASERIAMQAAAALAETDREKEQETTIQPENNITLKGAVDSGATALAPSQSEVSPTTAQGRGRPQGKRPVQARQTVYLDAARHAALVRIAADRGRSVHSLILEGIDHVIGKPSAPGWQ